MITERLMQFIWQFQYFQSSGLTTTAGEPLCVIHPGTLNTHQGPDFSGARIRVDDKVWVGNVELHVNPHDWKRHAHDSDPNYAHVILHVVWFEGDGSVASGLPTLVLEHRIPGILLRQYSDWLASDHFIPCDRQIADVNGLIRTSWIDRLVVERLQRKCGLIMSMLDRTHGHWEEVVWWLTARHFGGPVNGDAFEEIARSLPMSVMSRHRGQIHQLEALLLGQAGLLKGDHDDKYFVMLQKEYVFYQRKYALHPVRAPVHFLRMRPPSFPTVRLAQLAKLFSSIRNIFSYWLEAASIGEWRTMMTVTANDYWHYHYRFDAVGKYLPKVMGQQLVDTLLINAAIPVTFAYGSYTQNQHLKDKAMGWLSGIKAETNSITRGFARLGVSCGSAAESQALLELKAAYCDQRRCLDCAIGHAILRLR